jgi:cytochrome c oxidase assembly protein subunit 15
MVTGQQKNDRYPPHRWAVALACATFPLIWAGGLVTTYDAGMAVPDWPSTFGYNLFLYPWTTWFFGPWDLFIEHGHRLLGALVGLLTIGLLVSVMRRDSRRWMKQLAVLALLLVLLQGGLGGARVLLNERFLALVHGCVGPLFFAYAAAMAVFTSRAWRQPVSLAVSPAGENGSLQLQVQLQRVRYLAVLTTGMIYAQLIVGAHVRHVMVQTLPGTFRVLVMFHLLMAAVVVLHVGLLSWSARHRQLAGYLRRPVAVLAGLVALQMILGPATWVLKYGWPMGLAEYSWFAGYTVQAQGMVQAMIVTAHVATGSLLLALAVVVVLRATCSMKPLVTGRQDRTADRNSGLVNLFLVSSWMGRGQLTS